LPFLFLSNIKIIKQFKIIFFSDYFINNCLILINYVSDLIITRPSLFFLFFFCSPNISFYISVTWWFNFFVL